MMGSFIIHDANEVVFGLTYEEWSIKWWSWILGVPKSLNPTNDTTGEFAFLKQNNSNVVFLCQTFEAGANMPIRSIMIPRGTSIFMPLINWISVYPVDGISDEELIDRAKKKIDSVGHLMVSINGNEITKELREYRIQTKPFDVPLSNDNILALDAGLRRVVSDGYWIFTKPLNSSLSMRTFGSCTSGLTKIGVTYKISISEAVVK
jgi:hypothetical protein